MKDSVLDSIRSTVFKQSNSLDGICTTIEGYDFNKGVDYHENTLWTPSKVISRLGEEINNESSYLYWAYKALVTNVYSEGIRYAFSSLTTISKFFNFEEEKLVCFIIGSFNNATP
ncbi:unnamed protein product [Fraxinus pennsylvanica]|uniref:Uncharacterized protein n=1 Tax=Fraxinus pennsylvanica TaxID=56036 RepID=A0AAD2A0N6_9LAMI|nr:unnamed protein product [Fraxinus pennsylvanica]